MKNYIIKRLFLLFIPTILLASCIVEEDVVDPGTLPEASFIFQSQNEPGRVSFASTSSGHKSLAWEFGDGTFAFDQDAVTKSFSASGIYYVQLTATNIAGTSTFGDSIVVQLPPELVSSFSISYDAENPLKVNLNNTSINADSFEWNFGDGNTSDDGNLTSYTYNTSGTYTIRLRAESGEESENFRIEVGVVDLTDIHSGANKNWVFRVPDTGDNSPSYFVEKGDSVFFNYTLLPCELNDVYSFNSANTFQNNNQGDARLLEQGGECKAVEEQPLTNLVVGRDEEAQITLRVAGSYIGDFLSGPTYTLRELTDSTMTLAFNRVNPFNTAETETVVMEFVPAN